MSHSGRNDGDTTGAFLIILVCLAIFAWLSSPRFPGW